jgi:hypothetical protein
LVQKSPQCEVKDYKGVDLPSGGITKRREITTVGLWGYLVSLKTSPKISHLCSGKE